ncbi:hypothetical protein E2C01_041528 [Portunus trituberculatus]|uniref:Uncharacterized protein n=1 Tax=Portunus trituberculatus TaxID=210409 RepID=A0A5B7FK81_PORTR|nr:hypothetical protein [Portunus trituberculatus]
MDLTVPQSLLSIFLGLYWKLYQAGNKEANYRNMTRQEAITLLSPSSHNTYTRWLHEEKRKSIA